MNYKILKDAEILMKTEMISVKGGNGFDICASCCTLNNGGSSGKERETK